MCRDVALWRCIPLCRCIPFWSLERYEHSAYGYSFTLSAHILSSSGRILSITADSDISTVKICLLGGVSALRQWTLLFSIELDTHSKQKVFLSFSPLFAGRITSPWQADQMAGQAHYIRPVASHRLIFFRKKKEEKEKGRRKRKKKKEKG